MERTEVIKMVKIAHSPPLFAMGGRRVDRRGDSLDCINVLNSLSL